MTIHIHSIEGKRKKIGVMNLKEELTLKSLPEIMHKIRSQFPLKSYPTLIVSYQKMLHEHRKDQAKKVNPFTDQWIKGVTWIDPSILSSHVKTGYAAGS